MKKFKRIAGVVLSVVMICGLTACGDDSNNNGEKGKQEETTTNEFFGVEASPAEDFEYKDNSDGSIYIYSYKGEEKEIVVFPNEIDNKRVSRVGFGTKFGVKKVYIPEGVDSICINGFNYCYDLETISIPESVTEIDYCAFSGLKITEIKLPSKLEKISIGVFKNCKMLKEIEIPDEVTVIERTAFSGCESLTEIEIPGKVTKIDDKAFEGCTNLKKVVFKNSDVNLYDDVFEGCDDVTLYGEAGSKVEKYAKENNLKFVAQ